jgi:hypothetical protein
LAQCAGVAVLDTVSTEHHTDDAVKGDNLVAFIAFEIEFNGLGASQVFPYMVTIGVIVHRRGVFEGEERLPRPAMGASLGHDITVADIND